MSICMTTQSTSRAAEQWSLSLSQSNFAPCTSRRWRVFDQLIIQHHFFETDCCVITDLVKQCADQIQSFITFFASMRNSQKQQLITFSREASSLPAKLKRRFFKAMASSAVPLPPYAITHLSGPANQQLPASTSSHVLRTEPTVMSSELFKKKEQLLWVQYVTDCVTGV